MIDTFLAWNGVLFSIAAGLVPVVLWKIEIEDGDVRKWVRYAVAPLLLLVFWLLGWYHLMWDFLTPWMNLHAWWMAGALALFGSILPSLFPHVRDAFIRGLITIVGPIAMYAFLILGGGALVYLLAKGHQSADPKTVTETLDILFLMGVVTALIAAIIFKLPHRMIRPPRGGGGGGGHGHHPGG